LRPPSTGGHAGFVEKNFLYFTEYYADPSISYPADQRPYYHVQPVTHPGSANPLGQSLPNCAAALPMIGHAETHVRVAWPFTPGGAGLWKPLATTSLFEHESS